MHGGYEEPVCNLCRRRIVYGRNEFENISLSCMHEFHSECLLNYFENNPIHCPVCRRNLSIIDLHFFARWYDEEMLRSYESGYETGSDEE